MKKYFALRLIASISALAVAVGFVVSCAVFSVQCKRVRDDVLRLHILANSDSDTDQAVKLCVRDALLAAGSSLFDGTANADNARQRLEEQSDYLTAVAQRVLENSGFDYAVNIYVAEEYFETRSYGDVTMPAGKYTALKVVLGEGKGHNWWCVMFPPLCLPAACAEDALGYFDGEQTRLVEGGARYEIRFKLVEIFERLKNRVEEAGEGEKVYRF